MCAFILISSGLERFVWPVSRWLQPRRRRREAPASEETEGGSPCPWGLVADVSHPTGPTAFVGHETTICSQMENRRKTLRWKQTNCELIRGNTRKIKKRSRTLKSSLMDVWCHVWGSLKVSSSLTGLVSVALSRTPPHPPPAARQFTSRLKDPWWSTQQRFCSVFCEKSLC